MLSVGESNSKRRKSRTTLMEDHNSKKHDSRRPSQVSQNVVETNHTLPAFDNFNHIIYEKAALIYAHLKGEPDTLLPTFDDERVKRRAYSLAFGAKKCELSRNINCCLRN